MVRATNLHEATPTANQTYPLERHQHAQTPTAYTSWSYIRFSKTPSYEHAMRLGGGATGTEVVED